MASRKMQHLSGVDDLELPLEIDTQGIDWAGRVIERQSGLPRGGPRSPGHGPGSIESRLARHVIHHRRERERLIGAVLFCEPVWEMVLQLFIAQEEGERLTISQTCMASAAPPGAALRWLSALAAEGKVVRRSDPGGDRKIHVELAPDLTLQVRDFLKTWIA